MKKNMTALVSAFARAYHYKNNDVRVFSDSMAEKILSEEEYSNISQNMSKGIDFFNPHFHGNEDEALSWIVNNYLSPSPIGRSAFTEIRLKQEIKLGTEQYIIVASGYDTFAYRQKDEYKNIRIFEIDKPDMIEDKKKRIECYIYETSNLNFVEVDFEREKLSENIKACAEFNKNKKSFISMLGISYYLKKEDFIDLIFEISKITPEGSSLAFDYPDENYYTIHAGVRAKKQIMMASAAGEIMKSSYSFSELEKTLSDNGFLIYEHLTPDEITEQYFNDYNLKNPNNKIIAFDNVNYLFAVKKI